MLNLNRLLSILLLGFLVSSCETVQPVTKVEPVVQKVEAPAEQEPKKDEGLIVVNSAIESIKENDLDNAQQLLESFLIKNKDDNRVKLNLALIYLTTDLTDKAKELLNDVIEIEEDNSIALEHLAIIARQEGQFDQAKDFYQQALDNSDAPSLHLNYAILLDVYLNDLKPALEHYTLYKKSNQAEQDKIEIDKWIADLTVRIERASK